jgi:hypothetical protein
VDFQTVTLRLMAIAMVLFLAFAWVQHVRGA